MSTLHAMAQHTLGPSIQKAPKAGVPWEYTNTQVWGDGIARLSSLTVQLATTASMCLLRHVPKQADFRWFQKQESRWGLTASLSMT